MEKKYFLTYEDYEDDGKRSSDLFDQILNDPDLPQLTSIVIGSFGSPWDEGEGDCQKLLDLFVAHKEQFQHIRAFFIGDMGYEECEVSWIIQGNYEAFLQAFPQLESLTIKGSNNLVLGSIQHQCLKSFIVICGGLPSSVINDIANAKLPNLERLVLYVGVEDYGFDGDINEFKKLTQKELFPNLKHLGLVDSAEEDQIVALVMESDLLPQLEVLEFCYGVLSDKGAQLLLDQADRLTHLKECNLEYHFLTDEMQKKLKQLPFEVNLDEANDPKELDDEYGAYPMLTE